MSGKRQDSWEGLYSELEDILAEDRSQPQLVQDDRSAVWRELEKLEKANKLANLQILWLQTLVRKSYMLGLNVGKIAGAEAVSGS